MMYVYREGMAGGYPFRSLDNLIQISSRPVMSEFVLCCLALTNYGACLRHIQRLSELKRDNWK